MPSGAVADQRSMRTWLHLRTDLLQMLVHRLGVGGGHDDSGPYLPIRADRAEQVDRIVTIVPYRRRPRADRRPLVGDPSLLTHSGFILKPNLQRLTSR